MDEIADRSAATSARDELAPPTSPTAAEVGQRADKPTEEVGDSAPTADADLAAAQALPLTPDAVAPVPSMRPRGTHTTGAWRARAVALIAVCGVAGSE